MLSNGAHIDQATNEGDTAIEVFTNLWPGHSWEARLPMLSLKCLTAKVIRRNQISVPPGLIPDSLTEFLEIH